MRGLQPGEPIAVEDHHSVEVWTGRVERVRAVIVLVNRDKPAPVELRPSAPALATAAGTSRSGPSSSSAQTTR